ARRLLASVDLSHLSHTHLVMIYKVRPGHHMSHQSRVSAISCRNTLHVRADITGSIQGFSLLDFVHHLPHVHLDLSFVLSPAIESHCKRCVNTLAPIQLRLRQHSFGAVDVRQLLWYTRAAPAINPMAQLNLKAGPNAPLPEKEGAYRSVVSMNAGPM